MPHLMLYFEATRQMKDIGEEFGQIKHIPTGQENIKFVMIDTDKNQVIELEAEAIKVKQIQREPKWAEKHALDQVLSGGDPNLARAELERVEAERNSYREKHLSAKSEIERQEKSIKELIEELKTLRHRDLSDESVRIIEQALDSYIMELAGTKSFTDYNLAKELYHHMTGHAWADEFGDDDDEEGDLSAAT